MQNMAAPGVEPGVSRPQRDILAPRRCRGARARGRKGKRFALYRSARLHACPALAGRAPYDLVMLHAPQQRASALRATH